MMAESSVSSLLAIEDVLGFRADRIGTARPCQVEQAIEAGVRAADDGDRLFLLAVAGWRLLGARWTGAEHEPITVGDWLARVAAGLAAGSASQDAIQWHRDESSLPEDGRGLHLSVRSRPSPALLARFDAEAWPRDAVEQALRALAALVARWTIQDCSGQSLAMQPGLSLAQHKWLLRHQAGPIHAVDESLDVPTAFLRQARIAGDAAALRGERQQLSYRQLDDRSARLARRLAEAGIGTGDRVALEPAGRDVADLIALLAILRSGAAYVPIDARLPADMREGMLDDAGAAWLLVREVAQPQGLPDGQPGDEGGWQPRRRASVADAGPGVGAAAVAPADRIAYLMFTSGSTGRPKAIPIRHRSILRLVLDAGFMPLDADHPMLVAAPLSFDASTLEIWGPLLNGGCCVLHEAAIPTASGLARTISRGGARSAWLTASLFNAIVDQDVSALASLSHLAIGGEALSVVHVRRALDALPGLQLINGYGPTETTTFATTARIEHGWLDGAASIPIGRPINNTWAFVLDGQDGLLPPGLVGELALAGDGLTPGYVGAADPDNALRLRPNPFDAGGPNLYRTGDRVRWLPDGQLEYLGRLDTQIKIRGFRIELSAIESLLARHPAVVACAVRLHEGHGGHRRLDAFAVPADPTSPPQAQALRRWLAERLPDYMVPATVRIIESLPLTINGKIDRRRLPVPLLERPAGAAPLRPARDDAERRVAAVFETLLGLAPISRDDNVFDLGADSLIIARAFEKLADVGADVDADASADGAVNGPGTATAGGRSLRIADFYADPTIAGIAAASRRGSSRASHPDARIDSLPEPSRGTGNEAGNESGHESSHDEPIAIVAMAGRFPGAADVETFWNNLCEGRESIRRFRADELDASIPASLRDDPFYVAARGVLDDVALFDAEFFGIGPREAELIDPQQRLFLELAWQCIERAGHAPDDPGQIVGVFAGMHHASYLRHHVLAHPDRVERVGEFQVSLGNEKDYIATRVAHRLNLRGPAVAVNTACSTSLVAISQAVDSLRLGHCTMALAGGASITCPPDSGYLYEEGSMLSPDGHTRSFDANAQGTVFSDGVAVVLLKPLSRALADGNPIHALILGTAVNNDGARKASFTAPSVDGQAAVIRSALDRAGVSARSLSYVEAHGTATPLGDPVEVEALTRVFAQDTDERGFCAIGSVKSQIGHSVIAAGATGVIKTAMALEHECIPPTLHFTRANPRLALEHSPFQVNASRIDWPRGVAPRRAGVSSFGVGGTNAHAVLQEAPTRAASTPSMGPTAIRLSARTPAALRRLAANMADHLRAHPGIDLADLAFTLERGRSAFGWRSVVTAADRAGLLALLGGIAATEPAERVAPTPRSLLRRLPELGDRPIWLFPGQGAQYVGMGSALARTDPEFGDALRAALDAIEAAADDGSGRQGDAAEVRREVRRALLGEGSGEGTDEGSAEKPAEALRATRVTQPALFCIEYALGRAWMARGLMPAVMVGHSVGEFAAATLAGVFSLRDAASLVLARGRMMQALPSGSMLSVSMPEQELLALLPGELAIAAVNAPRACVVAGPTAQVESFARWLADRDVAARMLHTSHAFHSPMMEPACEPFEALVRATTLNAPKLPIVSCVTGELLDDTLATDSRYWARHMREPVRFSAALLAARGLHSDTLLLEVGPRATLCALARQHGDCEVVASLEDQAAAEPEAFEHAAAQLWAMGAAIGPRRLAEGEIRHRLTLPTYPFERKRFWVDAVPRNAQQAQDGPRRPVESLVAVPNGEPIEESMSMDLTRAGTKPEQSTQSTESPRRAELAQRLRSLFEDISGFSLSPADAAQPLLALGFDSLMLTQAALQVKRAFSVPVTFRQLMEEFRTLDMLAAHLDASLPPAEEASAGGRAPAALPAVPGQAASPAVTGLAAASAQAAPAMTAMPIAPMPAAPISAAPGQSLLQQVISQQMQLMARQLELLGGARADIPAIAAAPVMDTPVAVAPVPMTETGARNGGGETKDAKAGDAKAADAEATPKASYDAGRAFGAIARIHQTQQTLTERQRARLDALIRRYCERTAASKAFTEQHRAHLADPRVVNGFRPLTKEMTYQIVIERSRGAHLWDLDGNRYVDALNGFGSSLFGWQPAFVVDAVKAQLDAGYEIGPQHPLAGEVAELICEATGFDRAGLCNTGSEAVMAAIRIARTVTGRDTVVLFSGAYHGTFDEVVTRAGREHRGMPAAPGILPGMFGDVRVLDYGSPEALEFIERHAGEIAAVLVEPVQSRRPDFQPREFLARLREVTERAGTCLVFDEVITGFRCHPGGAQALFGVRADLATYGKVIGGGYPVGVVAGRREFMDALDGGQWRFGDDSRPTVGVTYFAGTFVRHPLALAACKASLLHLKAQGESLQSGLNLSTAALADELNAFCRASGAPVSINYFSSLWRVSMQEEHPLQDLLYPMMRSRGVHILDNFPCFLTTAHTPEDIAAIKTAFKESLAELQEADFLPRRAVETTLADAAHPPVPDARLGRDPSGNPAWFVPNPREPGKYMRIK